jgi:hypothetical protein
MRGLLVPFVCAALLLSSAPAAEAQSSAIPLEFRMTGDPTPGWSFTPSLDYAFMWDSNVLIENAVSDEVSEQLHVFRPNAALGFYGRRGTFDVNYHGAFVQHPRLPSLNSYDQRLSADARRLLTRRVSLEAQYGASISPTTELLELVGVPFSRVGSQRQDARGGITAQLSRRLELSTSYRYQWVRFDDDPNVITVLNGGQSHGGNLGIRHALAPRLALTADYDLQRGSMVDGQRFTLQNSWAGVDYQLTPNTRVSGSGGLSYLGGIAGGEGRRGPALRVGLSHKVERAQMGVSYSRSFVPSYSFGGTSDNEELNTHLQLPIARRWVARGAFALRRNDPLEVENLSLRSMWVHGSIGYLLNDWARVEAFSGGTRQDIDRPGGLVNRYVFGLQVTAATTARIR